MNCLLDVCLLLAAICGVQAYPALEERAACNKDNLLNAFTNPTRSAEASSFCSAYISVPQTSYVTKYTDTCTHYTTGYAVATIHPLQLFNLQPLTGTPSPVSYNSASPTPVVVPGGSAYNYHAKKHKRGHLRLLQDLSEEHYKVPSDPLPISDTVADNYFKDSPAEAMITPSPTVPLQKEALVRRASTVPLPTWLATTYPPSRISSACSCISPSAAYTTTVSLNDYTQITTATCTSWSPAPVALYPAFCAPSLQANAPQPSARPGYRASSNFWAASKMDCCATCANYLNCVWWKFDFGTPGDGWKPGQCHFGYYTGRGGDGSGSGNVPAVCPNGVTQAIDINWHINIGKETNNDNPGYNYGPCGNAFNVFESAQDSGYPEPEVFHDHDCGLLQKDYYAGACS